MHKLPHVPAFFRYYCLFVSVMLRHLFFPVILRLDRSILKRDNRSRRQIARSSRAMTERGKRRKMMLRGGAGNDVFCCHTLAPFLSPSFCRLTCQVRLDRSIRRNGDGSKEIARSSRAMTLKESNRAMITKESNRETKTKESSRETRKQTGLRQKRRDSLIKTKTPFCSDIPVKPECD